MILTCNSCGKKFVVPDSAITASGRMVQCGSCGNKWRQFPVEELEKTQSIPPKQKIQKPKRVKKTTPKKQREISLYSPEYLAKKHGIQINDTRPIKNISKKEKGKVSFGFYNSILVFTIFSIFLLRIIYFSQSFIIKYIPQSAIYLNYLFETIRNLKDIILDFVTIY